MTDIDLGMPLHCATTDQLIDELGTRHKGVVVIFCSNVPGRPGKEAVGLQWRGGATQAYGLICEQKIRLEVDMKGGGE